jgi:cellulose synthase/poly-beta-1,6-N-acetylglucosamine synthase-like glycosyltransferase
MYPVIVAIAKQEQRYIEEWVKYHLGLGFSHIYLYDNEDKPTYKEFLKAYADNLTVNHFPKNNYHKGIQYIALDDFINVILKEDNAILKEDNAILKKDNKVLKKDNKVLKNDNESFKNDIILLKKHLNIK